MFSSPRAVTTSRPLALISAGLASRFAVSALAGVGGSLAVLGATLPWLTFFGGLVPVMGTTGLAGQLALGLGAVSVVLAIVHAVVGSSAIRWGLALNGAALLAVAGWVAVNLVASLPAFQADPLTVTAAGPGVPVLVLGAALAFSTFFVRPATAPTRQASTGRAAVTAPPLLLPAALAFAGLVHLYLGPQHLAESALIGGAMTAAGLAQLALAVVVPRPLRLNLPMALAVAGLSATLVVAWLVAVTVGLPVEQHPHEAAAIAEGHGRVGHVEAVSPLGVATSGAELLAIALVLLARPVRRPSGR